jgi:Inner membrane component of T3SS, cytoplasmic domain
MSLLRAFLEIIDGPGRGRRVTLRDGQVYHLGRTDQSDVSFPENQQMSSVHFSARWFGGRCEIKDLASANGTWRADQRIKEATLHPGEDVRAGKATFRLIVEDGMGNRDASSSGTNIDLPIAAPALSATASPAAAAPAVPPPELATGLAVPLAGAAAQLFPLEASNQELLSQEMTVAQFAELLMSREQYLDAIRLVAHALAKRSAVEWACRCVRLVSGDDLAPAESAALTAAEAWIADPTEEHRREAGQAAEATKQAAAGWAAMAAFWSGGSMAPPQAPVVPPGPTLTAHAAGGAVMLAAVARQPEKAPEKYGQFVQIARELMAKPD